jgi:hypothetical protein
MLQPGARAMLREDAMSLLRELGGVEERVERLRSGLRLLLEDEG